MLLSERGLLTKFADFSWFDAKATSCLKFAVAVLLSWDLRFTQKTSRIEVGCEWEYFKIFKQTARRHLKVIEALKNLLEQGGTKF